MTGVALSVSQLTALVSDALARVPDLEDVLVEGEVSNLSSPASGHLYFTLKDANAQLRCVCFRGNLAQIPFRPENGMTVILHGRVDIYQQAGAYQLYVDRIDPSGVGALALAVEQRKQQLASEGLFDVARKRKLPLLPRCVVVVTSPSGAALQDVTTVIRRRAPGVDIVVVPAVVQGVEAVPTLLQAMSRAQLVPGAGVILLVRGGGSLEDLMAFNDADLARAIAASKIPVVSGVGHETDFTIADLAADQRAPTPSAAAEMVVPDARRLAAELQQLRGRLDQAMSHEIRHKRRLAELAISRMALVSPQRRIAGLRQDVDRAQVRLSTLLLAAVSGRRRRIDDARIRLQGVSPRQAVMLGRVNLEHRRGRLLEALTRRLGDAAARLGGLDTHLHALSPLRVLDRGYSITRDAATGKVVIAATATPGTRLLTQVADGEIDSTVTARRLAKAAPPGDD